MTEVTQADREAFASVYQDAAPKYAAEIRAGEHDGTKLMQAFARHRTIAVAELEAKLAESEQRFNDCRTALLATGASLAEARVALQEQTDAG